jgi:hypothetical protein
LLLVKKHGKYISGVLIDYDGACAHLRDMGVFDGNRDYVRDGAIAAACEFCFQHWSEMAMRRSALACHGRFLMMGRFVKKEMVATNYTCIASQVPYAS